MDRATRILVLTLGGALGVNARYWLGLLLAHWFGSRFPWATFLINVSGSFLIGLIAMILVERWPDPMARIFLLTGFLGGYTTFSSAMFESFSLWESGERRLAAGNLVGSFVAGLIAVTLGVLLGRWLVEPSQSTPEHSVLIESRLLEVGEALAGHEPSDEPVG